MSGKRPAAAGDATDGPRQFKQTKLNFFTSASRKPKVELEEDRANLEEKQPPEQPEPSKTTGQPPNTHTTPDSPRESDPESSPPPPPPPPLSTTAPTATTPPNPTTTTKTKTTMPPTRLRITDRTGDLFAAPANTLLIHACNTIGSWGGGIALAFRKLYPAEFRVYRAHCARSTPDRLAGTALLIPPQGGGGDRHYIGCLFTSRRFGAARDSPDRILRATGPAMRHLMRLVAEEEARAGVRIAEVRMCRINSGLFAVPWDSSKRVLEEMDLGDGEVPACAEEGVVEVVAWERE
ncbi:hypothetical protein B0I37DRAFT_131728 [Chaetomium sp. MPI-CAGE-AT-0009]|nr:hypothetical protein B0I37DRAFT_131728 [Chaetomium sp. MPI-CAGE-AT-0009]